MICLPSEFVYFGNGLVRMVITLTPDDDLHLLLREKLRKD